MQEIQFLEFMDESNLTQVSPNYLICMHFIRISTVDSITQISHAWIVFLIQRF